MKRTIYPGEIDHKDALSQVCPMSRNRDDGSLSCQGQDCMAWRWKNTKYINADMNQGFCGMVRSPIK